MELSAGDSDEPDYCGTGGGECGAVQDQRLHAGVRGADSRNCSKTRDFQRTW